MSDFLSFMLAIRVPPLPPACKEDLAVAVDLDGPAYIHQIKTFPLPCGRGPTTARTDLAISNRLQDGQPRRERRLHVERALDRAGPLGHRGRGAGPRGEGWRRRAPREAPEPARDALGLRGSRRHVRASHVQQLPPAAAAADDPRARQTRRLRHHQHHTKSRCE